jgi:hypothetical protein
MALRPVRFQALCTSIPATAPRGPGRVVRGQHGGFSDPLAPDEEGCEVQGIESAERHR